MIAVGYIVSTGPSTTRGATALIPSGSNSGPAFAAVAIAFGNEPEILGAITSILFMQIVVGLVVASYAGRETSAPADDEVPADT